MFIHAIGEGIFALVLIVWLRFQAGDRIRSAGDYFRRKIWEMKYQKDYKAGRRDETEPAYAMLILGLG